MQKIIFILGLSLLVSSDLWAQRKVTLEIGKPAPMWSVGQGLNAEDKNLLKRPSSDVRDELEQAPNRIGIIEFWASWCSPCIAAIPHLSQLQRKYGHRGLSIFAVAGAEGKDDRKTEVNEPFDSAKKFVKNNGAKMDYYVFADPKQNITKAYMDASGNKGIPCSFIVDQAGILQWIGNPHHPDFDKIVLRILEGRYDAVKMKDMKPVRSRFEKERKLKNWDEAIAAGNELFQSDTRVFAGVVEEIFTMLLDEMENKPKAYEWAMLAQKELMEDGYYLSEFAEHLLTVEEKNKELDIALVFAKAAVKAPGYEKNTRTLSVLADVYAARGELENATKAARTAYQRASRHDKKLMKRRYDTFKRKSR